MIYHLPFLSPPLGAKEFLPVFKTLHIYKEKKLFFFFLFVRHSLPTVSPSRKTLLLLVAFTEFLREIALNRSLMEPSTVFL